MNGLNGLNVAGLLRPNSPESPATSHPHHADGPRDRHGPPHLSLIKATDAWKQNDSPCCPHVSYTTSASEDGQGENAQESRTFEEVSCFHKPLAVQIRVDLRCPPRRRVLGPLLSLLKTFLLVLLCVRDTAFSVTRADSACSSQKPSHFIFTGHGRPPGKGGSGTE